MIDCPNGDVRDLLPAYLNDGLSAASRAEVEAHLAGCEECRAELALLRDLRATMRREPAVDVDAIAAAIAPYRVPVRRSMSMGWRAAAAIVALAAGGTSIALLRDAGDRPASAVPVTVADVPAATPPDSVSIASTPASPARSTPESTRSVFQPTAASSRELAIASSAIGELSDGELGSLVEQLESLDAVPSAEIEASDAAVSLVQEDSR